MVEAAERLFFFFFSFSLVERCAGEDSALEPGVEGLTAGGFLS